MIETLKLLVVNASDFQAVRTHPRNFLNPAGIADPYDFNRDQRVNAADLLIVRDHATNAANRLILLSLPSALLVSNGEGHGSPAKSAPPNWIVGNWNTVEAKQPRLAASAAAETSATTIIEDDDDDVDLYLAAYSSILEDLENEIGSMTEEPSDLALLEYVEEL